MFLAAAAGAGSLCGCEGRRRGAVITRGARRDGEELFEAENAGLATLPTCDRLVEGAL